MNKNQENILHTIYKITYNIIKLWHSAGIKRRSIIVDADAVVKNKLHNHMFIEIEHYY